MPLPNIIVRKEIRYNNQVENEREQIEFTNYYFYEDNDINIELSPSNNYQYFIYLYQDGLNTIHILDEFNIGPRLLGDNQFLILEVIVVALSPTKKHLTFDSKIKFQTIPPPNPVFDIAFNEDSTFTFISYDSGKNWEALYSRTMSTAITLPFLSVAKKPTILEHIYFANLYNNKNKCYMKLCSDPYVPNNSVSIHHAQSDWEVCIDNTFDFNIPGKLVYNSHDDVVNLTTFNAYNLNYLQWYWARVRYYDDFLFEYPNWSKDYVFQADFNHLECDGLQSTPPYQAIYDSNESLTDPNFDYNTLPDFNSTSNYNFTSTIDGDPVVKAYKNFTINNNHTISVSNRCRGLYLTIYGNLTIAGTLSMTDKGPLNNIKNFYIITDKVSGRTYYANSSRSNWIFSLPSKRFYIINPNKITSNTLINNNYSNGNSGSLSLVGGNGGNSLSLGKTANVFGGGQGANGFNYEHFVTNQPDTLTPNPNYDSNQPYDNLGTMYPSLYPTNTIYELCPLYDPNIPLYNYQYNSKTKIWSQTNISYDLSSSPAHQYNPYYYYTYNRYHNYRLLNRSTYLTYSNQPVGGSIYLKVFGNINILSTGKIESNGHNGLDNTSSNPNYAMGGTCGSGGGIIHIFYNGNFNNSGNITVDGGKMGNHDNWKLSKTIKDSNPDDNIPLPINHYNHLHHTFSRDDGLEYNGTGNGGSGTIVIEKITPDYDI